MYTAVLATMLAAGSTTPAWHHCHSCSGYAGYNRGCYSGCHSYPGYRPFFHRHHCHSNSYCSSCSYCSSYVNTGCSSCHYSSCYCSTPVVVYGCTGCYSATTTPRVIAVPPAGNSEVEALRQEVDRLKKALQDKSEKVPLPKSKGPDGSVSAPVSSRVTVTLPSDARLWVENIECPLTSSVRTFNTPLLNANQKYFYNIKVEVVRDGRPISESQRVVITPGQEVRVDFNGSAVGTASR